MAIVAVDVKIIASVSFIDAIFKPVHIVKKCVLMSTLINNSLLSVRCSITQWSPSHINQIKVSF